MRITQSSLLTEQNAITAYSLSGNICKCADFIVGKKGGEAVDKKSLVVYHLALRVENEVTGFWSSCSAQQSSPGTQVMSHSSPGSGLVIGCQHCSDSLQRMRGRRVYRHGSHGARLTHTWCCMEGKVCRGEKGMLSKIAALLGSFSSALKCVCAAQELFVLCR